MRGSLFAPFLLKSLGFLKIERAAHAVFFCYFSNMNLQPVPGVDPTIWSVFVTKKAKSRDGMVVVSPLDVALAAAVCPEMVSVAKRRKVSSLEKVAAIAIECGHSMKRVFSVMHDFYAQQDDLNETSRSLFFLDKHISAWCLASAMSHIARSFSGEDRVLLLDAASILREMVADRCLYGFSGSKKSLARGAWTRIFSSKHCSDVYETEAANIRFGVCKAVRSASFGPSIDDLVIYGLGISMRNNTPQLALRTTVAEGEMVEYPSNQRLLDEVKGAYLAGLLTYPFDTTSSGAASSSIPGGIMAGALGAAVGAATAALLRRRSFSRA